MATLLQAALYPRTYFSFCTISTALLEMQARLLRKTLFLNRAVKTGRREHPFVWRASARSTRGQGVEYLANESLLCGSQLLYQYLGERSNQQIARIIHPIVDHRDVVHGDRHSHRA